MVFFRKGEIRKIKYRNLGKTDIKTSVVVFGKNDIRTRLPWMTEPYRSGILRLCDEVWKPMCEKYQCSYANLFEAWTLAQYENLSLLIGFRHRETIENTVKCLDIHLEKSDLQLLSDSVRDVQVKVLDK